nr:MAG: ORF2 protein [Jingmen bat astrovirus 11]
MASADGKKKQKKTPPPQKVVVKKDVKPTKEKIRKIIRQEEGKIIKKKGLVGPKVQFQVKVTATIGKLGPNSELGPEVKIAQFLNPALAKGQADDNSFGPLQAAAAQYGLWRVSQLVLRFTPLVGPSAVSGTVFRVSLNLSQAPSMTSWGGLGARHHRDVQVGRPFRWSLSRGYLSGPRDTWWLTNTNEDSNQSVGPCVEVHGLGETFSTYKDSPFGGDLFIVEVNGTWDFASYTSNPSLGMLQRQTHVNEEVTLSAGSDGLLTMSVSDAGTAARFMCENVGESGVGETVWQVLDGAAGAVGTVVPPPFNWLVKGGWWLVKKIAGRAANGPMYQVYASLADAQANKPCVVSSAFSHTFTTEMLTTQINSPSAAGGVQTVVGTSVEATGRVVGTGTLVTILNPIWSVTDGVHDGISTNIGPVYVTLPSVKYFFMQQKEGMNYGYFQFGFKVDKMAALKLSGENVSVVFDANMNEKTGNEMFMYDPHGGKYHKLADVYAWGVESLPLQTTTSDSLGYGALLCRAVDGVHTLKNFTAVGEGFTYATEPGVPMLATLHSSAIRQQRFSEMVFAWGDDINPGDWLLFMNCFVQKFDPETGQFYEQVMQRTTVDHDVLTRDSSNGIVSLFMRGPGVRKDLVSLQLEFVDKKTDDMVENLLAELRRRYDLVPRTPVLDAEVLDSDIELEISESEDEGLDEVEEPVQTIYELLRSMSLSHQAAERIVKMTKGLTSP